MRWILLVIGAIMALPSLTGVQSASANRLLDAVLVSGRARNAQVIPDETADRLREVLQAQPPETVQALSTFTAPIVLPGAGGPLLDDVPLGFIESSPVGYDAIYWSADQQTIGWFFGQTGREKFDRIGRPAPGCRVTDTFCGWADGSGGFIETFRGFSVQGHEAIVWHSKGGMRSPNQEPEGWHVGWYDDTSDATYDFGVYGPIAERIGPSGLAPKEHALAARSVAEVASAGLRGVVLAEAAADH
jgi:hypothetical protein